MSKVNNAGVLGSTYLTDNVVVDRQNVLGSTSLKEVLVQTYETAEDCLKTNYYGIKQLTEALLPLLQKSEAARIVNVSSALGQLRVIANERAEKELGDVNNLTEEKVDKLVEEFLEDVKQDLIESKGWPLNISSYIVSKAALNAYTRVLAKKYPEIATNAVSPGFTKTDINQNTGINTVEEGAEGPVKLALIADTRISCLYFEMTEESTFD
ncbi:(+)-neomenthol dehydrogenase-like [Rosa chinensis]|uniref:(+)-neomenthol dehydrogenase n=1 Tax=Rosa chinensis TaxID=74649 RepID=UPI001AD906AC|nr:(+)-neomenthol dehydrogenase [Rosa chinensis]XP_040367346.1 (+)-neomenthol dehydrogenase-like [Rosa chinensis]